ncbi:hypothetical protein [Limisalsivibrio acetivorans]|uniref:hypothetical protein n=1 Tax=Limisalsivibrio acetivorans TaxID=1304888 RepID=UPI0003B764AB|nr:hypothetical protein [Limisalsivibrio acetivorans]
MTLAEIVRTFYPELVNPDTEIKRKKYRRKSHRNLTRKEQFAKLVLEEKPETIEKEAFEYERNVFIENCNVDDEDTHVQDLGVFKNWCITASYEEVQKNNIKVTGVEDNEHYKEIYETLSGLYERLWSRGVEDASFDAF